MDPHDGEKCPTAARAAWALAPRCASLRRPMDLAEQERALLDLARRLGVQVRRESFDPGIFTRAGERGGLCMVRGQPVVLLDASLDLVDRVVLLCEALCAFDFEPASLAPPLRLRLELARRRRRGRSRLRRPPLRRVV